MGEPQEPAARGSRAFRAELAEEIPRWVEEGLLDAQAADVLRTRYAPERRGAELATAAVLVLGVLLVGGGVISFVAWNWDAIPAAMRLGLLLATTAAAHVGGWWMWRVRGAWPRAGHALVLLGTLVYGASIGLVAQTYHLSATWYGGFGAWAAGALLAAWAYGSIPNAVLAAGLAATWACGWTDDHPRHGPWVACLAAAVLLPLAWRLRSRWTFGAAVVATVVALAVSAGEISGDEGPVVATILAATAPLLAWRFAFAEGSTAARFGPVAWATGVVTYGWVVYFAAFREPGREFAIDTGGGDAALWVVPAAAACALALGLVAAGFLRRPAAAEIRTRAPEIAAALLGPATAAALVLPKGSVVLTVVANAALVVPAAIGVWASVTELSRHGFWLGTVTLALVVVSRFLEYDTNLGVKAAVFVASGIAVILVGMAFERRLRAREA